MPNEALKWDAAIIAALLSLDQVLQLRAALRSNQPATDQFYGLALGTLPAAAGVSPEALAQLPALRTEHYRFDQPEIRTKVGQTVALRLEDNDTG
jgi:hypothetical protein